MLYQFCIMLASSHPFVAAAEKKTCPMQRSRGFGHGVVISKQYSDCVQDLDYRILIVFSFATRLLQTNEQLSRLSF